MAARDPKQASLNAAIAANERWSREDPVPNAEIGQAGLLARFEREAREAEPGLDDAEYVRRAECARRAHMIRLGKLSGSARRAARAGTS
ncbi:MAG TPA: hypothetical protein VGA04_33770 [Streptosporangiaceae bacterium]